MNNENKQQEILFVTSTTLCQRELHQKDPIDQRGYYSEEDRLEEACWNGMLDELIPEVMQRSGFGKKLVLWNIHRGPSLLHIQLCESEVSIENRFSLDAHLFLPFVSLN
jgi:hypothetical protein